jgi:hypothetical protein
MPIIVRFCDQASTQELQDAILPLDPIPQPFHSYCIFTPAIFVVPYSCP